MKIANNILNRLAVALMLTGMCAPIDAADHLPKPTEKQLNWQNLETIGFIHFSINTFTDKEWGFGNESPSLFNPSQLDCRQWVRTCKQAGLKGVILTAKHHDGFCLWPSAYTEYSIKNSPWKNGQGDLVKEFAEACKEYDMKLGLYLSPWDCNHPEYGDAGYITYFRNQLRELLTNYGPVFEIWFDGANGGRGYYSTDSLHNRKISPDYYNWEETVKIVKELQPDCIIHGGGKADIRWVGNEEGHAGQEHWSSLRTSDKFDKEPAARFQLNKGHSDGTIWMPSETDVSVRPGWYYHASEDHKLKSLPQLLNIYYESVGRNSLLLLNIPPDKRGLIHREDSVRLIQWYNQYQQELSNNLISKSCKVRSSSPKGAKHVLDSKVHTYWSPKGTNEWIEIAFPRETQLNRILLRENIKNGQRIKRFRIEYLNSGKWLPLAEETTIGYKRILRFPEVKAEALKVTVLDSHQAPELSDIACYFADELLSDPVIRINKKDEVTLLSDNSNAEIWYTLDGSEPQRGRSVLYTSSFPISENTCLKVMSCTAGGRSSELVTRHFSHSRKNWKVLNEESDQAELIFDENPATAWFSKPGKREVIVDFNESKTIEGIFYTPDQARYARGIALKYEICMSDTPDEWNGTPCPGEFSNIENNPIRQELVFDKPISGRYIRIVVPETVSDQAVLGIAELDFLFTDVPKDNNWSLIWSDEFDQDGAPDPEYWSFPGRKPSFWAKYATDNKELAYVKDGVLNLVARIAPAGTDTLAYQTGAVCTKDKFSFKYGKVEFKARFKSAKGSWPALWLMPQKSEFGGWPHSGEIDVMEHLNFDNFVYQTVHTTKTRAQAGNNTWENSKSHIRESVDKDDFNTYGIEWNEDGIEFFVNGIHTFTYKNMQEGPEQYPFVSEFYLILNQALGGNWVGSVSDSDLPVKMEVDWVRVYQNKSR
ncbi:MAG: alpha-L-fucosidase [Bacteroidales bacterium]